MKLTHVTIQKYKCYESPQDFQVEEDITVLVGKNEAGKTAILEAIAKTNYFTDDKAFKFDPVLDYPRKEKKKYDRLGKVGDVITAKYIIDEELAREINGDLGEGVFVSREVLVTTKYDNTRSIGGVFSKKEAFLTLRGKKYGLTEEQMKRFIGIKTEAEAKAICAEASAAYQNAVAAETAAATAAAREPALPEQPKIIGAANEVAPYFKGPDNWDDKLAGYVWLNYLSSRLPKFLYYSEYYTLPSRIDIELLNAGSLNDESLKTAKALVELADLSISEVTNATNFERFVSELEATGNEITQQLFKYWTTNQDLRIRFQIDKQEVAGALHHILDIRVENLKHMITLPLRNRSKGFNWFFSFIVWFSKIQEDQDNDYVILLDEPGLSLHASAQADLLRFFADMGANYQIIYTTHSPFMVESDKLSRVRTIYEDETATRITDAIQQRDSDTLFPLQAALGYDIAQNLFISKRNLLVEGPADLVFLGIMSSVLEAEQRIHLQDDITIVPVGGLDKVASFIALLRGTKLNVVCLLDTFTDPSGKQRVDNLIQHKIIREKDVRFFDEFSSVKAGPADLEDMFEKSEYLEFFNGAFTEYADIAVSNLPDSVAQVIPQINKILKVKRYNHFRPSSFAARQNLTAANFSGDTLKRFEDMFKEINSRF